MARAQPLTNTPQHSLSHTATQKPRSGTPHTQLAHKLCVPSTRARTPSTVPLLGSGGASQSRELHWLASQRGRLGERGVGGAAAAGRKCLKLTTSFTTNKFYHPQVRPAGRKRVSKIYINFYHQQQLLPPIVSQGARKGGWEKKKILAEKKKSV
jgi:hypothetical protein